LANAIELLHQLLEAQQVVLLTQGERLLFEVSPHHLQIKASGAPMQL
tara:strand:+ start:408 stop:548 length:141 start_codon:yes stop_codon:yes gene_type:complete